LFITGVEENLVLEFVDAIVEVGENREEAVDESVDDSVEEFPGLVDCLLSSYVSLSDLGESWALVAVDGDKELFRVEAVDFDQAVLVRDRPIDDHEDEVVVVVQLRPLAERLRILDRERVELENITQDGVVRLVRLVDVDSEERLAGEQRLDVLAAEAHLLAPAVVNDHAGVRPRPLLARRNRTILQEGRGAIGGRSRRVSRHRNALQPTGPGFLAAANPHSGARAPPDADDHGFDDSRGVYAHGHR